MTLENQIHDINKSDNNNNDSINKMGNSVNNYFLQLKESLLSLLILKLKPSLYVAKESMPLYLFDNYF